MSQVETFTPPPMEERKALKLYRLNQRGINRIPDKPNLGRSGFPMELYNAESRTNRAKARSAMREAYRLLGVKSPWEIPSIVNEPAEDREARRKKAYERIGNMFDIEATGEDLEEHVRELGQSANHIIDGLVERHLSREKSSSRLESSFEVKTENDPVELALMMFTNPDQRKRFEAKRKLVWMKLLGAVRQRGIEKQTARKFKEFLELLNEKGWVEEGKIGPPEYIVSTHNPDTLECTNAQVVSDEPEPAYGQMVSEINRRKFELGPKDIPVFLREHEKTDEGQAVKMAIKGEEHPDKAVDDEAGIMVVFDSEADIRRFGTRLEEVADEKGSLLSIEDEEDSLDGQGHDAKNPGSSPEAPMYKFHARFLGMRVEIMCHTYQSYTNFHYKLRVAHDAYAVRRLFESGLIALNFPEEIYGHTEEELFKRAMGRVRRNLRSHINFSPQDNSGHGHEGQLFH